MNEADKELLRSTILLALRAARYIGLTSEQTLSMVRARGLTAPDLGDVAEALAYLRDKKLVVEERTPRPIGADLVTHRLTAHGHDTLAEAKL